MRVRLSLAVIAMLSVGLAARAQFTIVSQSAIFDPSTQLVDFTIDFSRAPDFMLTDQYGRQADSFQYLIGSPNLLDPFNYDSIFRGEEIHNTKDLIPIRNSAPPVADPDSGGWGSIRDEVPFALSGDVLSFSAPLSAVSDHSNGVFSYTLQTYQYGAIRDTITTEDTIAITPEPSSFLLLATGLLGVAGVIRKRFP